MKHLSNRAVHLVLILFVLFILSGCTANVANIDKNGLRPHLTVDLQVPANIKINEATTLSVVVYKGNQLFDQAEDAVFKVWLEDNPNEKITLPAEQSSSGLYEVNYVFPSEGLYIIQSHIIASDMEVMPSKRVAIGKAAMEHLTHLEQEKRNHSVAPIDHSHH